MMFVMDVAPHRKCRCAPRAAVMSIRNRGRGGDRLNHDVLRKSANEGVALGLVELFLRAEEGLTEYSIVRFSLPGNLVTQNYHK